MDKQHKPTNADLKRHKEIERRVKAEGVQLDHPQGRERFEAALRRAAKKH